MVKRILALAAALLLLTLTAFGSGLGASDNRVYDYADIFYSDEIIELERSIDEVSAEIGMDIVVLTSEDLKYYDDYDTAEEYAIAAADDFYDQNGFGAGERNSGIIYFLDMSNRIPVITTCGAAIDYITGDRLSAIFDDVYNELGDSDYAGSAQAVIDDFRYYVKKGIPEGQFQYDINTGEILTEPHKALTAGELGVGAVAGALLALIRYASVSSKYKLKGSTYSYDLSANSRARLTNKRDDYVTTRETRVRRQRNESRGGGGGGVSFGGGSGVHMSGGGVSHGGGGGGHRF